MPCTYSLTLYVFLPSGMQRKPKPQPLALSLQQIENERVDTLNRTHARIAALIASVPPASSPSIPMGICLLVLVLYTYLSFASKCFCECTCNLLSVIYDICIYHHFIRDVLVLVGVSVEVEVLSATACYITLGKSQFRVFLHRHFFL